jgi:glycosyltransferase involved in cell wall biosynthesis
MGKLVSVVMPSYNDSAFIEQTLRSVIAQTHRPLEIIVVDDGSTDGTADLARRCCPEARVIEQANAGAAAARNRGLAEARGEYVAFLDADDLWHPRKTELQLAHLRSCGECVAAYCRKVELHGDVQPAWADLPAGAEAAGVSDDPSESGWLYLELLRASVVHTSTVLVSREVVDRVGRFDETLRKGQDLEFWLRLSRLGPIHMLDGQLSAYRIHPASISHRSMPVNFHAQVVEAAAGRFGPTDPAGNTLRLHELANLLASSWFQFAYHHFREGTLDVCRDAIRRSLEYRPLQVQPRLLAVRTAIKSLSGGRRRG